MASAAVPVRLLSRGVQTGKTSQLRRVVDEARAEGKRVFGVLAPDEVCEDGVLRRRAHLVSSGQNQVFQLNDGQPCPEGTAPQHPTAAEGEEYSVPVVKIGNYAFARSAFDAAAAELAGAAKEGADLVVVDEIGPLEINRGEGLHEAMKALLAAWRACPSMEVIVVVRPMLRSPFLEVYGLGEGDVQDLSPGV
eukprot:NODE_13774_length_1147_cov_6.450980.p1 GENE.NODE_13774_length_1147_cov_6.450980~~NODE_13774_length_1147_cov_6.450980.p1  ORF type:complete len:193 (+),score=37.46 NODE_13774_length_1147_cov_6.450980:135-713(+)